MRRRATIEPIIFDAGSSGIATAVGRSSMGWDITLCIVKLLLNDGLDWLCDFSGTASATVARLVLFFLEGDATPTLLLVTAPMLFLDGEERLPGAAIVTRWMEAVVALLGDDGWEPLADIVSHHMS